MLLIGVINWSHCEERSDEAILRHCTSATRLLRCARNDSYDSYDSNDSYNRIQSPSLGLDAGVACHLGQAGDLGFDRLAKRFG